MKGVNKITFCRAQMMEVVQFYLVNYLLKDSKGAEVVGVKEVTNSSAPAEFEILLAENRTLEDGNAD